MRSRDFLSRNALNTFVIAGMALPVADMARRAVSGGDQTQATRVAAAVTEVDAFAAVTEASAVSADPEKKVERATETAVSRTLAVSEVALDALAPQVTGSSHEEALRTAFQAYFAYKAANPDLVVKPYLYFVDLGLDNRTPRGYVFDMDELSVVDGPFMVSHGNGSGRDGVPSTFTNRMNSNSSSLGIYLAENTYSFHGKSAGRAYTSVGLRLRGESGEFNDAAKRRGIVAHGAPYVTAARAGRSEGCPAMEPARAARLLPMLAEGGVVFIYSPNDARWLRSDPWVQSLQLASN